MKCISVPILLLALSVGLCDAGELNSWASRHLHSNHNHAVAGAQSSSSPTKGCKENKAYICDDGGICSGAACAPIVTKCGPDLECPFNKKCINPSSGYRCASYRCFHGKKCYEGPRKVCKKLKLCKKDLMDCTLSSKKVCKPVKDSEAMETAETPQRRFLLGATEDSASLSQKCDQKLVKKCRRKCSYVEECSERPFIYCDTDEGKTYHSDCQAQGSYCHGVFCEPGTKCETCAERCKLAFKNDCT